MLPKQMLNEFIGKVCYINIFESGTQLFRIVALEENWIKAKDESGKINIINGEMIKSIQLAKEKHQNKCQ